MFKRIVMVAVLGLAGCVVSAESSDAGIFFRPVRRVTRAVLPPYPVARAVLPPYPLARTAYYGPAYTPVYGPVIYGSPYATPYGYTPYVYGGGLSVSVGY